MSISYSSIPENLRATGFFAEFDPSGANTGSMQYRLLLIGQRLSSGSAAAGQLMRTSRPSDGDAMWGRGSMLSLMIAAALKARPFMEVWSVGLDDLPAGQQAAANLVFAGNASVSGTLRVEIADMPVRIGIAYNQAPADVAAALVAAINAKTDLPVTASVNGGSPTRVDIVARHKGTVGNSYQVRVLFESDTQPGSPTITITPFAGGTGNPDITDVVASMGDEWFNWMVLPWLDTSNMTVLEAELRDRFSAMRQIGGRAFCAYRGTYGATANFGDTRNCEHITCMGTGPSPTPPHIWAAVNAVVAGNSLMNDPAQQLTTLVLPGISPPAPEDRFRFDERNNLAFDGISTYTVDAGGLVRIENQLTMYQEDPQGNADDSMLHINVPELYDAYRRQQRLLFAPFSRYKLADDGNDLPEGQPIMTPKKARAMLLQLYKRMIKERGWCEDLDTYKATLLVEKQGNRLAFVDKPNWIDNLRQIFGRSELTN
jgi:phage tail sheath gpL-like